VSSNTELACQVVEAQQVGEAQVVDGAGEGCGGEEVGEVEHRSGRGGRGDVVVAGDVRVRQSRPVHRDPALVVLGGCRDLDRERRSQDPPECSRRAVARDGVWPTGEHRRHAPRVRRHRQVPHSEHAAMDPNQAAGAHPVGDRRVVETCGGELPPRDHPVLSAGEFGDQRRGR
jgi:hypothetical protein